MWQIFILFFPAHVKEQRAMLPKPDILLTEYLFFKFVVLNVIEDDDYLRQTRPVLIFRRRLNCWRLSWDLSKLSLGYCWVHLFITPTTTLLHCCPANRLAPAPLFWIQMRRQLKLGLHYFSKFSLDFTGNAWTVDGNTAPNGLFRYCTPQILHQSMPILHY